MKKHQTLKENDRSMTKGGIDLTSQRMQIKERSEGQGIQFHIDPATLQQLQNAPGFVPVIISVQPLRNLKAFLEILN